MAIKNIIEHRREIAQSKEDRKYIRELRRLRKQELYEDIHITRVERETNKIVGAIAFMAIAFSVLIMLLVDAEIGIMLGASIIMLILAFIYIEAFIRTLFEGVIDFISDNFNRDKDRRRAYKESKRIMKYAIKNDKISEDQISIALKGLLMNAQVEARKQVDIDAFIEKYSYDEEIANNQNIIEANIGNNDTEKEVSYSSSGIVVENESTTKETLDEGSVKEYQLQFGDSSISLISGDKVVGEISYDDIKQPKTKEEIEKMPYSTIFGYIEKGDKTIYIDMEKEIAIVK